MKITVIGTINKDLILPFKNSPIESFGGIFYDVAVLSQLLGKDDKIVPVSYVGEDIETTIAAVLNRWPNISKDGLIVTPEKNHKVILEYTSPNKRQEKSLFKFPPLTWEQIEPHTDADIIIVNLISGWDLELETFLKLSEIARSRLYLDIHYLVMGTDNLGRRFPEKPEHTNEWLSASRFVQMNENEYQMLAAKSRTEVDFFNTFLKEDQVLLATKGAAGATIVYQRDAMIGQKQFPAFHVPRVVDATGCGDSFGAGFVSKFMETDSILKAAEYANLVAAANLSLRGTNEMDHLKETMKTIKAAN